MISCVYCGGAHERPADIRRCWSEQQGKEAQTVGTATVEAPVAGAVATGAVHAVRAVRGPAALGRHVVVSPGAADPDEWAGCERVVVDSSALADPAGAVARLLAAHHDATSLVIELRVELGAAADSVDDRAPYEVGARHSFLLDELRHMLWSNAIDLRDPSAPRWSLVDRAVALGAAIGGGADIVVAGTDVWLDGGPVRVVRTDQVLHAVAVEHGSLAIPSSPDAAAQVSGLAPDQAAAVGHTTGTARIIAPAGSGKTRVLTERARHLVRNWRIPPSAVCLVAFNKRAQEEMQQRTADIAGLQVRTLNSIALAIVNGTLPFAPQPRRRTTIDEPAVRQVLQRFVATPKRRNTDPLAPWIEALGQVRLGLVDPSAAEAAHGGDVAGFADVLPRYEAALDRDGSLDFDGQIDRAIRVLLTSPSARTAAQRACRLLLVDEFQDLTPAHLLLVRLLAGPGGSVYGVGDDDQTIYGYNGADPGWLIDFSSWFPGAGDHPLEVNYRSPAGVVDVADRLLRHNRRRVAKTIRSASADAGGWEVTDRPDTVVATVDAVSASLAGGRAPSDIAVLTRVNAMSAPVMVALVEAGIPVYGGVGDEFTGRTAVRASLAWLRLASARRFAPDDLIEALRRPSRALHPRIMEWVTEQPDVRGLERLAGRLTKERDVANLASFADDISRLQAMIALRAPTSQLIACLVDDIGLAGSVATLDDTRRGMNRGSQGDDLVALRQLAGLQPDPARFEGWLHDRLRARRSPDGVTLATVHRVKGQEWPCVVVHHAASDQFPHRLADDLEEERRLFHVAITRASGSVAIVTGTAPSPFVAELTTEPPERPPPDEPRQPAARALPARAARRGPSGGKQRADHPLLDRSRVMAVVGTVLVDQGQEWTIVEIEPDAAVARRGAATRRFPIGAKVETRGRQRGALGARPGEVDAASAVAFDLLRQFRERARDGKPAYTVFDDRTLAEIAQRLPADADQLARVNGIGPAKLDQYGDDVLGLVADAVALGENGE